MYVNLWQCISIYVDAKKCDAYISPCVLVCQYIHVYVETNVCEALISPCVLIYVNIFMFM